MQIIFAFSVGAALAAMFCAGWGWHRKPRPLFMAAVKEARIYFGASMELGMLFVLGQRCLDNRGISHGAAREQHAGPGSAYHYCIKQSVIVLR